jgi:RPA family protein
MAEQQKRQIAYKARVKDLLGGKYVKEEGWNPNYVESGGRKISRVNLIGTIVSKESVESFQSLTLDDGTGKITARTFEKNIVLDSLDIGDVVLIIGRPREYGRERYVLIEIIKKIDNKKWILYRKAELDKVVIEEEPVSEKEIKNEVEEISITTEAISEGSPAELILKRIKELDKGEGADFDEVTKGINEGEKIISSLLSEGEVFEVKPGRLKVLE